MIISLRRTVRRHGWQMFNNSFPHWVRIMISNSALSKWQASKAVLSHDYQVEGDSCPINSRYFVPPPVVVASSRIISLKPAFVTRICAKIIRIHSNSIALGLLCLYQLAATVMGNAINSELARPMPTLTKYSNEFVMSAAKASQRVKRCSCSISVRHESTGIPACSILRYITGIQPSTSSKQLQLITSCCAISGFRKQRRFLKPAARSLGGVDCDSEEGSSQNVGLSAV